VCKFQIISKKQLPLFETVQIFARILIEGMMKLLNLFDAPGSFL